jgi:hypothetical protein
MIPVPDSFTIPDGLTLEEQRKYVDNLLKSGVAIGASNVTVRAVLPYNENRAINTVISAGEKVWMIRHLAKVGRIEFDELRDNPNVNKLYFPRHIRELTKEYLIEQYDGFVIITQHGYDVAQQINRASKLFREMDRLL